MFTRTTSCLISRHRLTRHTQLARVASPAVGGDPKPDGSNNATFQTLPTTDTYVCTVAPTPGFATYFAGGAGEVHIYGQNEGYVLYPEG